MIDSSKLSSGDFITPWRKGHPFQGRPYEVLGTSPNHLIAKHPNGTEIVLSRSSGDFNEFSPRKAPFIRLVSFFKAPTALGGVSNRALPELITQIDDPTKDASLRTYINAAKDRYLGTVELDLNELEKL